MSNFTRTFLLNLFFVLICPILLSFTFLNNILGFFIYLIVYSFIESSIDVMYYDNIDAPVFKVLASTMLFNFIIIYGISLTIGIMLWQYGLVATIFISLIWIALMSFIELKIDNKLIMKGKQNG